MIHWLINAIKTSVNPMTVIYAACGYQQTTKAPTYRPINYFLLKSDYIKLNSDLKFTLQPLKINIESACQGTNNRVVTVLWKILRPKSIWDSLNIYCKRIHDSFYHVDHHKRNTSIPLGWSAYNGLRWLSQFILLLKHINLRFLKQLI